MGSVNSPSISCRFGEGILNLLREEEEVFQGVTQVENTWRTAIHEGIYDPSIGHGYVFRQGNGRPIAQIFGFVDDFKIHTATREDCILALNAFMDAMQRLGLICQPVKTSPPPRCKSIADRSTTPTGLPHFVYLPTRSRDAWPVPGFYYPKPGMRTCCGSA